ncbi:Rieske (2Fe-2S) protein [Raineyella fluvialis]|uniref:Cytochrome bc1 complex Rieske iron-sulfur subunit n=1 Tax=Raineyella fluvialis TaxID=2662261 RepID=A0A5Q2FBK0_9ACTN|nr:Rieske (2Fe-2S) protein [Raineyella fluvialis]QGF24252.1 Rieske 2Fe-2S domain-containing protein [Raineyella fluvialis]
MQAQRRTVFKLAGAGVAAASAPFGLSACSADSTGGNARMRTKNNRQLRVKKADVPVGSGVIYPDEGYVVTQPTAGQFEAFSDVCPHQGCPVRQITADQRIHCLCHNSYFAIADGKVLDGPAPTGLTRAQFSESGDEIIVTGVQ